MKAYDRMLVRLIHFLLHRLRFSQEHGRVWFFRIGYTRNLKQAVLSIGFGEENNLFAFYINPDQWTRLVDDGVAAREIIGR